MPKLIVLREGRVERQVELGVQDLLIGRSPDNDIVLDDPDRTVSRHHAEVRLEETCYVIVDVGSQNGILQDGRRVERVELQPGRPVTVGSFTIGFESEDGLSLDLENQPAVPVKIDLPLKPAALPEARERQAPSDLLRRESEAPAIGVRGTLRVPNTHIDPAGGAHLVTDTHRGAPADVPPSAAQDPAARASSSRGPMVRLGAVAALVIVAALAYFLWPKPSPVGPPGAQAEPRPSTDEPLRKLLSEAETALGAGRLDEALASVDEALAASATDVQALALQSRVKDAIKAREVAAATPASPVTALPAPVAPAPPAPTPEPRSAPVTNAAAKLSPGGYPMLTRRGGETPEAWRDRSRQMSERYRAAGELLRAGKFTEAIPLFSAIAAEERGYQSVNSLLAEARYGLSTQTRQIVAGARKLEEGGDLPAALAELERAKQADPSLSETPELIRNLREHIEKDAADAYAKAKQHDAAGRSVDAAEQYDRVVKLLPQTDARHQTALARLKALRTVGR
jgi:tetratricopeptide (TPR) repeat protein